MPTADLYRWLAWIVGAFLLGSIPWALIISRAKGVDLRKIGSGNLGATNLGRALGGKYFALCFALDCVKGAAPSLAAGIAMGPAAAGRDGFREALDLPTPVALLWLGVAVAAVLGHMFSPFAGFRGGKGVATGLGAIVGIFPVLTVPALAALAVFLAVLALWRYVSAASIVAAACLPFFTFLLFELSTEVLKVPDPSTPPGLPPLPIKPDVNPMPWVVVTALLGALVIFRHRANLGRLAKGTEPKVGAKKRASAA